MVLWIYFRRKVLFNFNVIIDFMIIVGWRILLAFKELVGFIIEIHVVLQVDFCCIYHVFLEIYLIFTLSIRALLLIFDENLRQFMFFTLLSSLMECHFFVEIEAIELMIIK